MAFKAIIRDVRPPVGTQINIVVDYLDETTGWQQQHPFGIQDGSTMTRVQLRTMITEQGQKYKDALARSQVLAAEIGAELVI